MIRSHEEGATRDPDHTFRSWLSGLIRLIYHSMCTCVLAHQLLLLEKYINIISIGLEYIPWKVYFRQSKMKTMLALNIRYQALA
jgi:hypothetical protein